MTTTTTPAPTASTSTSVLHGLLTRAQLAADLGCHPRTVMRREREGMPHIKLGARSLYNPASVRAWVQEHECRPGTPKGRRR